MPLDPFSRGISITELEWEVYLVVFDKVTLNDTLGMVSLPPSLSALEA